MKYDYKESIKDDISFYMADNNIKFEDYEDSIDTLILEFETAEEIVGDTDGYADEDECAMFLSHNLDLVFEALKEYDIDAAFLAQEVDNIYTYLDCLVRNYLLPTCVDELIKEQSAL